MRRTCWICKQAVSSNGLAFASHMRAHVRKGEVVATTKFDSRWMPYTIYKKPGPKQL
jgi:hypothetical protein